MVSAPRGLNKLLGKPDEMLGDAVCGSVASDRGGVAILLFASCYSTREKLWDTSLCSYKTDDMDEHQYGNLIKGYLYKSFRFSWCNEAIACLCFALVPWENFLPKFSFKQHWLGRKLPILVEWERARVVRQLGPHSQPQRSDHFDPNPRALILCEWLATIRALGKPIREPCMTGFQLRQWKMILNGQSVTRLNCPKGMGRKIGSKEW